MDGLDKLIAKIESGKTSLRVGFLEGSTEPTGELKAKKRKIQSTKMSREKKKQAIEDLEKESASTGGLPVAHVASMNEYGSAHRPPRPFFRQMIAQQSPKIEKKLARLLQGRDPEAALDMLGQDLQGKLRESIQKFATPPLSEKTVKAKGFSKPLVDTGTMLSSVDYEVE